MDFLGPIADGIKWVLGGWHDQRVVDGWIADKAKLLRRQLAASFEEWPGGLQKFDDCTTWGSRLLTGFPTTRPAMDEIVDRRPQASARVRRVIRTARDEFYAAADIVTRLFKDRGLSVQWHQRPEIEAKLRTAAAHVHKCMISLASVEKDPRD